MTFTRETDLARIVAEHYRRNGARVFAEVEIIGLNERPDLVIQRGDGVVTVIETKLAPSIAAVAQAAQWVGCCHQALLMVPYAPGIVGDTREADLLRRVCKGERIGLSLVRPSGGIVKVVHPTHASIPRDIGILDALQRLPEYDPATATVHPGSPGKPEKPELVRARAALLHSVEERGRKKLRAHWDLVANATNPRIADRVIAAAKAGKVDGVRAERLGGLWFLGPAEAEEEVA